MKRLITALTLLTSALALNTPAQEEKTSGQGDWVFKYRPDLSTLPEGADAHIHKAHGGIAVDRQGAGDVYFHLSGYGLIHLSGDLTSIKKIEGDAEFAQGNGHNVSMGYGDDGKPYLVVPDNARGKVLVCDTTGKLLHTLNRPEALDWFMGMSWAPTDALVVDGKLLIADGYGSRYIFPAEPFGAYVKGAFGGRPTFNTNHGLDLNPVTGELAIADREGQQIRYFTKEGKEVTASAEAGARPTAKTTVFPTGATPCDVNYMPDGTAIAGTLKGAGGTPGEVYILSPAGEILSVVKPKLELGLDIAHVHDASWTKVGDTFFLLVYAWNPGGFFVLERIAK